MLDFASIASHIQVRIAEKMDFVDQIQFQLSSSNGKYIVEAGNLKAVFDIDVVTMSLERIMLYTHRSGRIDGKQLDLTWSKIEKDIDEFPRFLTHDLYIRGPVPLSNLDELNRKSVFVRTQVRLRWQFSDFLIPLFLKLVDMFTISSFKVSCNPDEDLFDERCFQEIESVDLQTDDVPDEKLLQLKSKEILFRERENLSRIADTTNQFLQQWFHKRRHIQYFLYLFQSESVITEKEKLLNELPFSTLLKWEDDKGDADARKYWMKEFDSNYFHEYEWSENDEVYSIDRGDMKLLVYTSWRHGRVVAREYSELDDVFRLHNEA